MKLESYKVSFDRGAPILIEALWYFAGRFILASPFFTSSAKCFLLRLFGAKVGSGVVIRRNVRIKFPWRLAIGEFSWIGEDVWIDNLAKVTIAENVCISQGTYLCTGSHDYKDASFGLITRGISIEDCCWIGAFCRLAPGAVLRSGVVCGIGSVVSGELEPWSIYSGNPARLVRRRPK